MRLGALLLLVVLSCTCVVGRQRMYFEAGVLSSSGGLVGVCVVGRQRMNLEAGVFSSSFKWPVALSDCCLLEIASVQQSSPVNINWTKPCSLIYGFLLPTRPSNVESCLGRTCKRNIEGRWHTSTVPGTVFK